MTLRELFNQLLYLLSTFVTNVNEKASKVLDTPIIDLAQGAAIAFSIFAPWVVAVILWEDFGHLIEDRTRLLRSQGKWYLAMMLSTVTVLAIGFALILLIGLGLYVTFKIFKVD